MARIQTQQRNDENDQTTGGVLGKRKQRDDANGDGIARAHGSTLFVSNLPYTATSTDLQTIFSDIAPVRSAFVVRDPERGTSKGVGYVSFAIREDAVKAMDQINGSTKEKAVRETGGAKEEQLSMDGRKLRVQWADKKPKSDPDSPAVDNASRMQKRASRPTASTSAPHTSHPRSSVKGTSKDPNAIRTITISGITPTIDQKTLWKKVRKLDGAESVEMVNGETGEAHALFKTPSSAAHAIDKLHAHVFKGSLLSVALKKRIDAIFRMSEKPSKGKLTSEAAADDMPVGSDLKTGDKGVVTTAAPSRANRLIVRNLPWNITERDLRALFLPYGPIHSVHIPSSTSLAEGEKPRAKGFAFVWFLSHNDAERAIQGANGQTVRPGAVFAPTMNKKERARARRKLRMQEGTTVNDGADGDDDVEASDNDATEDSEDNDEVVPDGESENKKKKMTQEGRVIAVDWALSKERWEQTKAEVVTKDEANEGDEIQGSINDDDESGTENEEEQGESESSDDDEGSASDNDEMDVDVDEDENVDIKPSLPPPEAGTTLFVRNVPFDAQEEELRTLFRAYGSLRYARITMDPETGHSRGTGFVCFWKKEDADEVVKKSEEVRSELANVQTPSSLPAVNPFKLPALTSAISGPSQIHSILTPDPTSSLARGLVLGGRTLDVVRAVTRDEAGKLKEDGERKREKSDKRSAYLLREGVIFPNSYEAAGLPSAEVEIRVLSFNRRRTELKSNPNLFVSRTRLSVRRLPLFVSEKGLKRMATWAIKEFDAQVKAGDRQGLTKEELMTADSADKDGEQSKDMDKKTKGTIVKQAKIVRQTDRADALTGHDRSRGYGFLELWSHANALKVLRFTNNNPQVGVFLKTHWRMELAGMVDQANKELKILDPSKGKLNDTQTERKEELESRLKRLKEEETKLNEWTEKGGDDKAGWKTLIVEFSIENMLIVKKREARAAEKTFDARKSKTTRLAKVGDDLTGAKQARQHRLTVKGDHTKNAKKDKRMGRSADKKSEAPNLERNHVGEEEGVGEDKPQSSKRRATPGVSLSANKKKVARNDGKAKADIVGKQSIGDSLIARKRRERRQKKAGK